MKKQEMASVNVEEGFVPKFEKKFLNHYGVDSVFVRALSDCYTRALVKVLDANNMVYDADAIAYYSNESAENLLSGWISSVEGAKELALQEAMGVKPIGSLEVLVDQSLGEGKFKQWLARLEEA